MRGSLINAADSIEEIEAKGREAFLPLKTPSTDPGKLM
jgi:hypothetical protein